MFQKVVSILQRIDDNSLIMIVTQKAQYKFLESYIQFWKCIL